MTDKATHTPLPWTFEAGVEDNEGEFYVCHAGTVCTETTVCNPRSEADARLIVHAVNSHHDLIEALRALELANDRVCGARPQRVYDAMIAAGMSDALLALDEARLAARAILTKAEAGHG